MALIDIKKSFVENVDFSSECDFVARKIEQLKIQLMEPIRILIDYLFCACCHILQLVPDGIHAAVTKLTEVALNRQVLAIYAGRPKDFAFPCSFSPDLPSSPERYRSPRQPLPEPRRSRRFRRQGLHPERQAAPVADAARTWCRRCKAG